jgi:hypothetical protein
VQITNERLGPHPSPCPAHVTDVRVERNARPDSVGHRFGGVRLGSGTLVESRRLTNVNRGIYGGP